MIIIALTKYVQYYSILHYYSYITSIKTIEEDKNLQGYKIFGIPKVVFRSGFFYIAIRSCNRS